MASPLVSVVVATYNIAPWLPECLTSISAQTYKNLEIIVVNDGSTDESLRIAEDLAAHDPRLRVISQVNGGLSSSRNTGIEQARGDYLLLVDGDDFIEPQMVELLLDASIRHDSPIALCDYYVYAQGASTPKKSFPSDLPPVLDEHGFWEAAYHINTSAFTVAWNKLYGRKVFAEARYPVGVLHEDTVAMLAVIGGHDPIAVVDEPLYHYRQRQGSIMASPKPGDQLASCEAIIKRDSYFVRRGWDDLRARNLQMLVYSLALSRAQLKWMSEQEKEGYRSLKREGTRILREITGDVLRTPAVAARVIPFTLAPKLYSWLLVRHERRGFAR